MLVVHSIERLDSYMNIGVIFLIDFIALIFIVALAKFTVKCIYDFVCKELDNCTYFGEDYERISKS